MRALASEPMRQRIHGLVRKRAESLADLFYTTMFGDPQAAVLLDHALVNARLRLSMQHWLIQLFDPAMDAGRLSASQRRVGEVHARIGVPIALVSRGARLLRRALCDALADSPMSRPDLVSAVQYVQELFSLAFDAMNSAFALNTNRLARSEEAYRLFFIGQDMKAERERRRSELLEWAHTLLERHYWNPNSEDTQSDPSQFGLWLHHKAAMLFEGAAEVSLIRAEMHRVERELLPRLVQVRGNQTDARVVVGEIHRNIDRIKELLGAMFDRYCAVDDGRDSVTSLLNRRYFPAIVRREIELSAAQRSSFSVLMVDIDEFRQVVDRHGYDGGNLVLAQSAGVLQDHLRAGDFVFRLGEDEFLVLLVECDEPAALRIAEAVRQRFAARSFSAGATSPLTVTVSIGVAPFDGHPDFQRLLERADQALRQAKQDGRNCCRVSA